MKDCDVLDCFKYLLSSAAIGAIMGGVLYVALTRKRLSPAARTDRLLPGRREPELVEDVDAEVES